LTEHPFDAALRLTTLGEGRFAGATSPDTRSLAAQADRPVLGSAWVIHFGNGYLDEHVAVWSDRGGLLATAQQIVYFKE